MNKKQILESFGQKIKKERKNKGLSQLELALAAKVGIATISMAEVAKQDLTMKTLYKIAKALKIEPYELLKFDDSHNK
jgi:HTH-type transcriptional regulator / antitoxin HipB